MLNVAIYSLLLCMSIATISSKTFNYQEKEYYLLQVTRTFDEAIQFCKDRNQQLVQINSEAENKFILRSIIEPLNSRSMFSTPIITYLWLGATNEIGTDIYNWLDGSEMTYSNWLVGHPDKDVHQRNGVLLCLKRREYGKWIANSPLERTYVLCEHAKFALSSKLVEQSNQFNAKIDQIGKELKDVISNNGVSQRKEFLELIKEVKQDSEVVRKQIHDLGQMNSNNGLIELESKTNDIAFELEFSKRQSNELITKLRGDVEGSRNVTELLRDEVALNSISSIKQRNELLKVINEEKQNNDIVYNKMVAFVQTNLINLDKQKDVNGKLQNQVNEMTSAIELQKTQSNALITKLNAQIDENKEANEMLVKQNEFLEMRLKRLEQKLGDS